ncbi:MAG: hypothetical protein ACRD5L_12580 [Bryobacteraceae bacterium]
MKRSLLAFLLAAVTLAAPVPPPKQTSVRIPVWIDGEAPAPPPQFEALLNNKTAPVIAARGPGSDEVILVVLDVTGDISLIDPARQALISEIGKLPVNCWVGLLRYQDGLHVLADPSPDRKKAIDEIQLLTPSGKPGLLETVDKALALADSMARKSGARIAVLYITDSDIHNYREDYTNPVVNQSDPHDLSRRFPEALVQEKISKLQEAISALQPPLFIVHLTNWSSRLNQAYQNGLKVLTDSVAGETVVCRSVAEIPDAIHRMCARIDSGWSVTVALPPKPKENLQVKIAAKSGDRELKLVWRQRLTLKRK